MLCCLLDNAVTLSARLFHRGSVIEPQLACLPCKCKENAPFSEFHMDFTSASLRVGTGIMGSFTFNLEWTSKPNVEKLFRDTKVLIHSESLCANRV